MPETLTPDAPQIKPRSIRKRNGTKIANVLVKARDTSIKGVSLFTPQAEAIVKAWITVEGLTAAQVAKRTSATTEQIRGLISRKHWAKSKRDIANQVEAKAMATVNETANAYAKELERIAKRSIKVSQQSILAATKAPAGSRLTMVREAQGALSIFRDASGTGKADQASVGPVLHLYAQAWGMPPEPAQAVPVQAEPAQLGE